MKKIILILVLGVSLFTTTVVHAQTKAIELTIDPPVEYIHIMPGEKTSHTLTIQHTGSQKLEITPNLVGFETDGETGRPILLYGSTFRHLKLVAPYLLGDSFILNPGDKKTITLQIDVPPDAQLGEFPQTLLFMAKTISSDLSYSTSGSEVSGGLGTNIIINVSRFGDDRGQLEIDQIFKPSFVDSFSKLEFTILAKNVGLNATNASGSATIQNWQGKTVAEFEFYPDMILANNSRKLRWSNPDLGTKLDPLPSISDNPSVPNPTTLTDRFVYDPLFLFGPLTMTVNLQTNGQSGADQFNTIVVYTLAMPISLIVISGIGLGLILLLPILKKV